jgi:D-hydroxyproline dehydrogenase subunit gamma
MAAGAQFQRIPMPDRKPVTVTVDGMSSVVFDGDTVLTAVLAYRRHLRPSDYSSAFHSGFCLMGACQDCWVFDERGQRVRSCSTPVVDGQSIATIRGGYFDA